MIKDDQGLSIESLEARVNLSSLAFHLPAFEAQRVESVSTMRPSATRVISLSASLRGSPTSDHKSAHTTGKSAAPTIHHKAAPKLPVKKSPAKSKPIATHLPTRSTTSATTTSSLTSATTSSPVLPVVAPVIPPVVPNALTPILAQLYGDDVHDDSGTIQQLIDTANADGITSIVLPAGTFKLDHCIQFYGTGITFSGQGSSTILDVNNNYNGNLDGAAIKIKATLDSTSLMIDQAITGNIIVFRGQQNITAGQSLFLCNGVGSTALIEASQHGADISAGEFCERGPDEYVQVSSVATDANGNTVATLAQNVLGTDDYFNVAPTGVVSTNYLNAVTIDKPAENLTAENFAVKFTDMSADTALDVYYGHNINVNNVQVLNSSKVGGKGGIIVCGTTGAVIQNIVSPNELGINSARSIVVENCTVSRITLEEAATDNSILHNTLTGTTTCDFRINDMACERNTFSYNALHGGVKNTGAIAIFEGIDTTVAFNTINGGATGIWAGTDIGTVVHDNLGGLFVNYDPLHSALAYNNILS